MKRVYLDWNATAPLRQEARGAMLGAMDVLGNPSSVHAEGREAKLLVEAARRQVAGLVDCRPQDVIFTSGATEAAALACPSAGLACSDIEHESVHAHQDSPLRCDAQGMVDLPEQAFGAGLAVQAANSETGILQETFVAAQAAWRQGVPFLVDGVQAAGKVPLSMGQSGADFLMLSAHKLGGPKGIGALCLKLGQDVKAQIPGGGQESGRRSGTENLIGIAGFGAAAEAAKRDLENGVWEQVSRIRNILEKTLEAGAKDTIFVGKSANRLPNTSCFISPGWKGETQVMQMDLAGFAISAGSACSSGKVKASRVLKAMGFSEAEAACAVRVSIGPTTTEEDVLRFAEAWLKHYHKRAGRAS